MSRAPAALKRLIVGKPRSSGELERTLLPKLIALPIFASDALSSMAYATQEILLVLATAGATTLGLVSPISVAVAILLAVVVISYRQIVRAYPQGGGAYVVAREQLGLGAGLLVGAALLTDYTLTVAVSVTAGVDAIVSATPIIGDFKVEAVILFIAAVTLANLRGVRESGSVFAVPSYGFVLAIFATIVLGFAQCLGGCHVAPSAGKVIHVSTDLSVILLLRAFAAGTTALTGVEAIAEGVPMFRFPQSKNAGTTLAMLAAMSCSMFLGISVLAHLTQVHYVSDQQKTVVAQIALAVWGNSIGFFLVQALTAAILILAANTAFNGFPVLMSILAGDRVVPRYFLSRGDKLVLSNGIAILAVAASILVWIFQANLNSLIQLYLIGVFISFTLAQAGTVRKWRGERPPKWARRAAINGFGSVMTGVVLVIVLITKFRSGAWIVVILIPVLMYLMHSMHKHFELVSSELKEGTRIPSLRRRANQHMIIVIPRVDAAAARILGYLRSTRVTDIEAVTIDETNGAAWRKLAPDIPLKVLEGSSLIPAVLSHCRTRRRELGADDFLTVVVPEVLKTAGLSEVVLNPSLHRLKAKLVAEPGVQVMDAPILKEDIHPSVDEAVEPTANEVVVLVRGLGNASLQAVRYAETLSVTRLTGLNIGLDTKSSMTLGNEWMAEDMQYPLVIEDAPFRDVGASIQSYIRSLEPDGINKVVTVVIPEIIVPTRRHRILHRQTALVVKRHLLFERGVVTVSVPYHLSAGTKKLKEGSAP